jgi:NAD(P)H-dependent FMN reductase
MIESAREKLTPTNTIAWRALLGRRKNGYTPSRRFRTLSQGAPMPDTRPLFIPVILGTPRRGRASEHVARFVLGEISRHPGVETELVDVREIQLPADDAGEAIKDERFSALAARADAFVVVTPEYNHGYPGPLKHLLDTNLKEYIHKAVGICGVSAGGFGGTRVIQNLLPVLRELGLVTIFWDGNFSSAQSQFDEGGRLLDESYVKRTDKFLKELIWMARVLRYGRENVPLE